MSGDPHKTFYLETFGCQMNVHDSEKVIGTLVHEGYRQVETVEQADLILYNTCSIRDKAEQKVFHRLADYKKLLAQGKKFGVLGCVAQQEGEKIFERAPACLAGLRIGHLSQSAADAGTTRDREYRTGTRDRAQDLVRITGLDDRETDECFETEFTARTNPHRGYITIIEGCDKFCAYCVVPFTRGKERSRTSESVLAEARQMADLGYTEIQLLGPEREFVQRSGQGSETLCRIAGGRGRSAGHSASAIHHFASRATSAATSSTPSTPCPRSATTCICPCRADRTACCNAMQRLYTREQYLERIAWMKAAKREISITSDIIVGFPGETEEDFAELCRCSMKSDTTRSSPSSILRDRIRRRWRWKMRFQIKKNPAA